MLMLLSFPGAMLGAAIGGYIFDIVGRRLTLFISFLIGSVFVYCIPYTAPSIFPGLLIVRIGMTLSVSAPASNPLLADYVDKESIGKAATLVSVGYILGEVLCMAVVFPATKNLSRYNAFLTVAIVGVVSSFLFLFIVKEP